jgi:1,4-alpha-glucan branching enzyme
MMRWVTRCNELYRTVPALHARDVGGGVEWVECNDRERAVLSLLRYGEDRDDPVLVVLNLTPVPRDGYAVGVPFAGPWEVLADSDDRAFGGSGYRSADERLVEARPASAHGRPASVALRIPPLAALFLRRAPSP